MREFWIEHPACQGEPVGFRRWLLWRWSEFVYTRICRLQRHQQRIERRALYGKAVDDDIPF